VLKCSQYIEGTSVIQETSDVVPNLIIPAFSNSLMLRKDKSNRFPLDVVMTRQGRTHAATLIVPRIDVVPGETFLILLPLLCLAFCRTP